jgi:hypothetical protein
MCPLKTLLAILLLFGTVSGASAKRMELTLEDLARQSQVIVSARVDSVAEIGGVKVAEATVLRPIAGWKAGTKLTFLAHRTWTCDSSHAVGGETVLLFLNRCDPSQGGIGLKPFWDQHPQFNSEYNQRFGKIPFYQMVNSGQGRMVVIMNGKTPHIIKPYHLEKNLPDFPHPDPRWPNRSAVRLTDVINRINKVLSLLPKGTVQRI